VSQTKGVIRFGRPSATPPGVARSPRRSDIQHELDGIFVINKGLDVNDRIVLERVRQVRDGEKVVYEFRKPEEVMANPKDHVEK
jgi:membrane fusion protein (multidrug efflux system)